MNALGMPGTTALFSGNWNNASNAGTFNWNLNNATSNVNSNIGTLLRKSTALTMKRKLVRMLTPAELTPHDLNVISSYHGWLTWCDGFRLSKKYIDPLMKKEVLRL